MSWLSQLGHGAKKFGRSIGQQLNIGSPRQDQYIPPEGAPGGPPVGAGGAPPAFGGGGGMMPPSMPSALVSGPQAPFDPTGVNMGGIGEKLRGAGNWITENPELALGAAGTAADVYGAFKEGQAMDEDRREERRRHRERKAAAEQAIKNARERSASLGF